MRARVKYKAALSVAYGAGLRAAEVVSLKVSDIDSTRMITASDEEVQASAEYFAALKPLPLIKVVETSTVPKTYVAGWFRPMRTMVNASRSAAASSRYPRTSFNSRAAMRDPVSSPTFRRKHQAGRGSRRKGKCRPSHAMHLLSRPGPQGTCRRARNRGPCPELHRSTALRFQTRWASGKWQRIDEAVVEP